MLFSLAATVAKLQQVPQGLWERTGVTVPRSRRSNFSGKVSATEVQLSSV